MRGGTSKGAYFLATDLPEDARLRDEVLLACMGSPDPRQVDGLGGAHPLTSKVAIGSRSAEDGVDLDFLFAQIGIDKAQVDTTHNFGNILSGVGIFALDRGLVRADDPVTRMIVRTINTGTVAEVCMRTRDGRVEYEGSERIDGVPGTSAPIQINFLEIAGSVCGSLLPTGAVKDAFLGTQVTCIDNGMPVVMIRSADVGLRGDETCVELDGNEPARARIERLRLEAGKSMGLGDVSGSVVPKIALISRSTDDTCLTARCLIPHRCHDSIGVFAAVSIATACLLPGSVADGLANVPGGEIKRMRIAHPTGAFEVRLEVEETSTGPNVTRAGFVRTARPLFDGKVFVSSGSVSSGALAALRTIQEGVSIS